MGSIVEAIGALALVVGLIVASGRLAQRGRPARAVGMARLSVVARASLGSKTSIVIVEADGQRFLLGVGPQGASRLASLGEAPPPDAPEVELLDLRDVDDPAAAVVAAFDDETPPRAGSVVASVLGALRARGVRP